MAERRSLTEGLKATPILDPAAAKEFIHAGKPGSAKLEAAPPTTDQKTPVLGRAPISTRIRADFAAALKRASLERQLNGKQPHTLQDILEQAIEPWLKEHGYLP